MYTFVGSAIWVYNTIKAFLLVSFYWHKWCSIIIDIHKWISVSSHFLISVYGFLIFVFTVVSGRVKVAPEPQEWNYLDLDMGNFII